MNLVSGIGGRQFSIGNLVIVPTCMKPYEEAATKSNRFAFSELAMPFTIYLLLYTLTLSRVPSVTADSINYINTIDSGVGLFHPHHLLYNSLAWTWIALCRLLAIHTDSEILASELNAIFGALGLCTFYSIIRIRLGCDRGTALLATGLPAFSFGFWYYSGCVDVYIIPFFFLLLSFYHLTAEHLDGRTFALVGFLNGMAVIFAEMSVLFAAVVFVSAWYSHRCGGNRLGKSLGKYVMAAVPTAAIPYLWALFSLGKANSLKSAWRWLTDYAHTSKYWSPLSPSSVFKAGIGLGQAFVGSHFLFALPLVRSWVEGKVRGFYLTNDVYLVRNLGDGVARLLVALSVALGLILMISVGVRMFDWPALSLRKQRLVYLLLIWVLAYGIFVLFYVPSNAKYWIAPSVCLWIIFLAFLLGATPNREGPHRWPKVILAIVVAVLFVVNFAGSIRFTRDRDNDYYYSQIQPLLRFSSPGDLIVIGRSWKLEGYLHRYGMVRVLSLTSVYETSGASPESVRQVEYAIEDELAAGGSVLISWEAVVPEQETIRSYPGITAFQTLWDSYRRRWITKEFQTNVVYILEPTKPGGLEPRHETYAPTLGYR